MDDAINASWARAKEIRGFASEMHMHPELSGSEYATTARLRPALEDLGAELYGTQPETGAAALLRGGKPGPFIALRTDIDAIRQTEEYDRPDRSKIAGVMHGCGHDVHTAALLGCAGILSSRREELRGDVLFIFQSAEETLSGAAGLRELGIFEKRVPDAIFGLHNLPELPVGTVGVKSGPLMSWKDGFSIRYTGRSGHTSTPQKNIDPTVAIAALIMNLQSVVSRSVGPLESAVVTVCSIESGRPFSTTVDDAVITGSIRTLEPEVRQRVIGRIRRIADSTAEAYGCRVDMDISEIVPGVVNSEELLPIATRAAEKTVGRENVVVPSVNLASEDFSILSRGIPSFFYFLGSGTSGETPVLWHNPNFHAAPDTPVYGAALMAQSVIEAGSALCRDL